MPPALENGVRGWLRSGEWQPEVGALHVADITLGLAMAALDPAHPGDQLLKRVELVGALAGMRVTGQAFSRIALRPLSPSAAVRPRGHCPEDWSGPEVSVARLTSWHQRSLRSTRG